MKIKTAEEFADDYSFMDSDSNTDYYTIKKFAKDFAAYHVEKALQEAFKNARIELGDGSKVIAFGSTIETKSASIDKHSITNAYPISNIK